MAICLEDDYRRKGRAGPSVIGLYGVSGCGKTHLLRELERVFGNDSYIYREGAEAIDNSVPGGLEEFKQLPPEHQARLRHETIWGIWKRGVELNKPTIVAGHFSFWNDTNHAIDPIMTAGDLSVYTNLIYLKTDPAVVFDQVQQDASRQRQILSIEDITIWQDTELTELRRICASNGIIFTQVVSGTDELTQTVNRLQYFRDFDPQRNLDRARESIGVGLEHGRSDNVIVVLDADKTVAPVDTGAMLWSRLDELGTMLEARSLLRTVFSGPMGYSDRAFHQIALLHEDVSAAIPLDRLCEEIADSIDVGAEMREFLTHLCAVSQVRIFVLTCGLGRIWANVMDRLRLSHRVCVLGNGAMDDGIVMTPDVKSHWVASMRHTYERKVFAIGDSPIDLGMLKSANEAYVVVYDTEIRSKSMEDELSKAVIQEGLQVRQVLFPTTTSPRLDRHKVPVVTLTEIVARVTDCVDENVMRERSIDLTDTGAGKLLMTTTRDASLSGLALRAAHRKVGVYLAQAILTERLGLETCPITHVQGMPTIGHRIRQVEKTTIIAMMRGGEPMALGVSEVLPEAMFVHAKMPEDVYPQHVVRQATVVLVDSVINTGRSIVEMVRRIRTLHPDIRIVIIAGVVQRDCVRAGGVLAALFRTDEQLELVALRTSENCYSGFGETDTGNRLYNTQHLP